MDHKARGHMLSLTFSMRGIMVPGTQAQPTLYPDSTDVSAGDIKAWLL